jgi:hypothetical protein
MTTPFQEDTDEALFTRARLNEPCRLVLSGEGGTVITRFSICLLAFVCFGAVAGAEPVERTILELEKRAMDQWLQGNPDGFLAISDPAITYFHSTLEGRLVGVAAVRALYETYRGRPLFDAYEIVGPKVVASGGTAVLTYQLVTRNGSLTRRWHATEVYRHAHAGWRIIHTHFSAARQ